MGLLGWDGVGFGFQGLDHLLHLRYPFLLLCRPMPSLNGCIYTLYIPLSFNTGVFITDLLAL